MAGTVLSAVSPTFAILIAAKRPGPPRFRALAPLCLSVLGIFSHPRNEADGLAC